MRPWAEHLGAAGFRVALPRLPGHGTSWRELNRTPWTDWYAAVDRAFAGSADAAASRSSWPGCRWAAALALRLAERHGPTVAGLVAGQPGDQHRRPADAGAARCSRCVVPSLAAIASDIAKPGVDEGGYPRTPLRALYSQTQLWRDVRQNLSRVDQPLLVYRSCRDHVVDPSSVALHPGRGQLDRRHLRRLWNAATM